MKHTKLLILNLLVYAFCTVGVFAQNERPCFADAYDTDTELREFGMGKGETAFEALTAAMNNAMKKIKSNVAAQFPEKKLEYSILSKSTSDGEEIELETTLGQPSVCQQEIECQENGTNCTVIVVLSFDIAEWLKENAQ